MPSNTPKSRTPTRQSPKDRAAALKAAAPKRDAAIASEEAALSRLAHLAEERLTALDRENSGTLSDDEADAVYDHGVRCFEEACAIRSATPADFLAKWRMAAPELRDAAAALGRFATLAFDSLDADLSGPAAAALVQVDDAELLALEAEYRRANDDCSLRKARLNYGQRAYVQPPMPAALKVWGNDRMLSGIPQTGFTPIGGGRARVHPYGEEEVKQLRANPCMGVYVGGTEGELQPDGVSRLRPDKRAQARADAIVAAWDEWQAAITAAREAAGVPALEVEYDEAFERRDDVVLRIRRARATSLAGLGVKARAAIDLGCTLDVRLIAEGFSADDETGLLFSLVADVLDLMGAPARG